MQAPLATTIDDTMNDYPILQLFAVIVAFAWMIGAIRLLWLNLDIPFTGRRPLDADTRFVLKCTGLIALVATLIGLAGGPGLAGGFAGFAIIFSLGIVTTARWLWPYVDIPLAGRRRRLKARLEMEERQRIAADRDRHRQKDDDHRAADLKRRDDARFACQLLYDRHRIELGKKFPPGQLESYFQQYMSDERSAGEVEERADRLRTMLQDFLDGDGNGQPKFQNVIELREFYHRERLRIDESDMETDLKDTLLADLAQEEESAIREFRRR